MSISDWLSLAFICLLGASSPGPSLMVILTATATSGRWGGIAASSAHGLGIFIYALASATGLSIILVTHQSLFTAIQIAGALLLLWMGGRALYAALKVPLYSTEPASSDPRQTGALIRQTANGFMIAVLNPKIAVFFLSLFSQFLGEGQTLALSLSMASLAGVIDTLWYCLIVAIASTALFRKLMHDYARIRDGVFGGLLILLSLSLLLPLLWRF